MARIIIISILTALMCGLFGCGVFDLKTPDAPVDGIVTEDPLYISDILRIANESSVYMNYRDYFTEDVVFEDYLVTPPIRGRENVVAMLERLRILVSHVEWRVDAADRRFEGNRWTVHNVPYKVYLGGHATCEGMADFQLVRDPDWRISHWKDTPDVGYAPFFER